MIVVFGSRIYGRNNVVQGWGYCDHCDRYGKHISYNGRKWSHLYYIPLIPSGSRVRVIKECRKCSHGRQLPEKEVPRVLDDMYQSIEAALAALTAGQNEFQDDDAMKPCGPFLAGSVEFLCCLGAEEYVDHILNTLQENNLTHAYHLVHGELMEFQGKTMEAADAYQQAIQCEPNDPLPLTYLGALYFNQNEFVKAQELYEKALQISPDEFPILQALLGVYEATRNYLKLTETYERCFELVPELTQEKKFLKAYKKACKKAGKYPRM